ATHPGPATNRVAGPVALTVPESCEPLGDRYRRERLPSSGGVRVRAGKALFLVLLTGLCTVVAACGQQSAGSGLEQAAGPGLSKDEVDRQDAATGWANDYW